jgi:hypothetical protein
VQPRRLFWFCTITLTGTFTARYRYRYKSFFFMVALVFDIYRYLKIVQCSSVADSGFFFPGSRIRIRTFSYPGSEVFVFVIVKYSSRIPDPGDKKAPDPDLGSLIFDSGSATLHCSVHVLGKFTFFFWRSLFVLLIGRSPGSTDCLVEPAQQPAGGERDVLGSLERFPSGSVGTLRSNGSIPTLERVRREISNHSIGSHSQTSSGQVRITCWEAQLGVEAPSLRWWSIGESSDMDMREQLSDERSVMW